MKNTNLTPKDWLERYYEHLGGEITLAFNTINANTDWALTLLSLLVSAIFLSGVFPDVRSFLVLLLVSPLLIRFFVRTTLGYQNLIRWNYLRNRIDKVFFGTDKDGSIEIDLLKSIDLYDWHWCSPMSRGRLFLANVRYGFAAIFILTYGLAFYAWFALDATTVFAPSPDRCWAMAAVFFAIAFALIEIKGLHDPFYFKHVRSDKVTFDKDSSRVKVAHVDDQNKVGVSQMVLRHSRELYVFAFVLLSVSVGLLAWPETRAIVVTGQSFPLTIRGYSLSDPIQLVGGDKVSFAWFSDSALTVIIAEMPIIQDFNKTGVLVSATGIYSGQSGHLTSVFGKRVAIGILVSHLPLKEFTGELTIQRTANAALGTLLGCFSLLPLTAILISQVVDVRGQEKRCVL